MRAATRQQTQRGRAGRLGTGATGFSCRAQPGRQAGAHAPRTALPHRRNATLLLSPSSFFSHQTFTGPSCPLHSSSNLKEARIVHGVAEQTPAGRATAGGGGNRAATQKGAGGRRKLQRAGGQGEGGGAAWKGRSLTPRRTLPDRLPGRRAATGGAMGSRVRAVGGRAPQARQARLPAPAAPPSASACAAPPAAAHRCAASAPARLA